MTKQIRKAVNVLRRGGLIAYPTETVYGLGCDPRNVRAVNRIFAIKGRTKKHPFLLVASSMLQVKKVAKLTGESLALARKYWPGPLTLVLPLKRTARLAPGVASQREVAIRVSSSPFVRKLTRAYGFPIVSTSANISGQPEGRSGRAVSRMFRNQKFKPDLIVDVGRLPRRESSTVVKVHEDGRFEIRREGAVRLRPS